MDFMKMIADWGRVVARSVLVFHVVCAATGLATLLGVISVPYMLEPAPSGSATPGSCAAPDYYNSAGLLQQRRTTTTARKVAKSLL